MSDTPSGLPSNTVPGESSSTLRRKRVIRYFNSTSRRTFILLPLALITIEAAIRRDWPPFDPLGLPLLVWGYLQCRMSAAYRNSLGGGGPGRDVPPHTIVDTGIYRFVRNPMYLGNIIFVAGLAIVLHSWVTLAVLAALMVWYEIRVREDEANLAQIFGEVYTSYLSRTRRWIPYIY